MASWLDRILNQPSPEQLVTSQLQSLVQLQQETNLLLRETLLALGRTPQTVPTITHLTIGQLTKSQRPRDTRIRGAKDVSSTQETPQAPPPSVEYAQVPTDPNEQSDQ